MSLRVFHLVFIAASIILAAFLAVWTVEQYRTRHDLVYLAAGVASLASAVALAVYASTFRRKTRGL